MKKIANITFRKYPCFVPMVNSHYEDFRKDIILDFPDVSIPTEVEMGLQDDVMWRVNLRPFVTIVTYNDGSSVEHHFNRGFITDYGSVPSAFQSLIRSDDPRGVVGFWNHDLDYQTKAFGYNSKGFKKANKLLLDTCLYYKLPHVKALLVKQAVDSFVGKAIYKKKLERDVAPDGFVIERKADNVD